VPAFADGGPQLIALVFEDELVDSLPQESHDARVDQVVTPERVVSF
jgi:5-formyltetrahydrofolate cyclo-ligase